MEPIKFTTSENHYWNNTGQYQTEMDRLFDKFVPERGKSSCFVGEAVRLANKLLYEYANNGNCNASDYEEHEEWVPCPDCCEYDMKGECCATCGGDGGWYEYDPEISISATYFTYLRVLTEFFEKYGTPDAVNSVKHIQFIIENNEIGDDVMCAYDKLVDYVTYFVLQNENDKTPLPDWYQD